MTGTGSYLHVTVDDIRVDTIAHWLAGELDEQPNHVHYPEPLWPADVNEFIDTAGVFSALNYCFSLDDTKWGVHLDGQLWTGAMGLCAVIANHRGSDWDLLDASTWRDIDLDAAQRIFASDTGHELPMLDSRVEQLHLLHNDLEPYEHTHHRLFNRMRWDARRVLDELTSSHHTFMYDHATHPITGAHYRFDKRARLYVGMVDQHLRNQGGAGLTNIDAVEVPVDYQLPRTLNAWGCLRYSDTLGAAIAGGRALISGSVEEIELRAATADAFNMLRRRIGELGVHVTVIELDNLLWSAGRSLSNPRHACATTNY